MFVAKSVGFESTRTRDFAYRNQSFIFHPLTATAMREEREAVSLTRYESTSLNNFTDEKVIRVLFDTSMFEVPRRTDRKPRL